MKRGFTLVEILIAVLIVVLLVAMATPLYEKTIEKSRLAEARTKLKRIYDSKIRILDHMDMATFSTDNSPFGFENLDFSFDCTPKTYDNGHVTVCNTKDFTFQLSVSSSDGGNSVCAARRTGDNKGVNFLYNGRPLDSTGTFPSSNGENFFCHNGALGGTCEDYGMDSMAGNARCSAVD